MVFVDSGVNLNLANGLKKIVDAIGPHRFQEVRVEGGGEDNGAADGKSAEEEVWRLDRRLTRISWSGLGDFFYPQ